MRTNQRWRLWSGSGYSLRWIEGARYDLDDYVKAPRGDGGFEGGRIDGAAFFGDFAPHIAEKGVDLFRAVCERDWEGLSPSGR